MMISKREKVEIPKVYIDESKRFSKTFNELYNEVLKKIVILNISYSKEKYERDSYIVERRYEGSTYEISIDFRELFNNTTNEFKIFKEIEFSNNFEPLQ